MNFDEWFDKAIRDDTKKDAARAAWDAAHDQYEALFQVWSYSQAQFIYTDKDRYDSTPASERVKLYTRKDGE